MLMIIVDTHLAERLEGGNNKSIIVPAFVSTNISSSLKFIFLNLCYINMFNIG